MHGQANSKKLERVEIIKTLKNQEIGCFAGVSKFLINLKEDKNVYQIAVAFAKEK